MHPHRYNPTGGGGYRHQPGAAAPGLQGRVFYTTSATHELRVRAHGSDSIFTVLTDAKHAHGFIYNGVAHTRRRHLGGHRQAGPLPALRGPRPNRAGRGGGYRTIYLHAITQYDWFFLTFSDGGKLFLMAAKDPAFLQQPRRFRLYDQFP